MYSKTCLTITSRWQNPNHQIFQKVRGFFFGATGRSRRIWKELELLLEEDTERLTGLYKHAATMRCYSTFFLSKKHSSFVICSFQKRGGGSGYGWASSSNFAAVLIKKWIQRSKRIQKRIRFQHPVLTATRESNMPGTENLIPIAIRDHHVSSWALRPAKQTGRIYRDSTFQ